MQDYPPRVTAFSAGAEARPDDVASLDPDLRSPARFLWWLLGQQRSVILTSVLVGVLWQLPLTVGPWLVGRAVDEGILGHSSRAVAGWTGLLLVVTVVGVVFGIAMHTLIVRAWLIALYGTTELVTRKTGQMGHVLPRRVPTGEVLSVASSDSDEFGALTEITARAGAQLIAYLVVAAIVLRTSVPLGLLVLAAAPVLVGVALPLLRPLHRRQELERTRSSELTSMATDIVAGLRILRGIGGETTFGRNYAAQSQRTRTAGVSAGIWQALVEATGVFFSGCFVVMLMWVGTREVLQGRLTVGELISFLGYGLFMIGPIQSFFEFAQKLTRALVSARKAVGVFEQRPPWAAGPSAPHATLPEHGPLEDEVSGFVAEEGLLTVIVSSMPEDSAALADRLGRYLPGDGEPDEEDDDDGLTGRAAKRARAERLTARRAERERLAKLDEQRAGRPWGVRLGGVDLGAVAIEEVRARILVADSSGHLFAGTLQTAVDPHGRLRRVEAEAVIRVANAEDVYDAMPEGWQGHLDERGRGLSGGQRQRLALARALGVAAPYAVLVEPTSAVDAHTEARIAERVAAYRRGLTTVVTTVSPLWLHHADRVVLLVDGRVAAVGTHDDLLAGDHDYRRTVIREEGPARV